MSCEISEAMTKLIRLLVCGDRNWENVRVVRRVLVEIRPDVVIEGEARGADSIAREIAESLRIPVLKYPAQWNRYGRGAGYRRNQQMLDEGNPTHVVAFHDDVYSSKGTRDMMARAMRAGVPTCVVTSWTDELEWHQPSKGFGIDVD